MSDTSGRLETGVGDASAIVGAGGAVGDGGLGDGGRAVGVADGVSVGAGVMIGVAVGIGVGKGGIAVGAELVTVALGTRLGAMAGKLLPHAGSSAAASDKMSHRLMTPGGGRR
ncbi:MAG: hypothetical protein HY261_09915 [Chloroflexi bacterium]|nr:hypothetical protein [Chloroflexota bacterium]